MYKVLIVDDEVLVRVGLRSTLDWESLGFSIVAEASNGEQGYEAYKLHMPDVVLTDIMMPKKDGLWLTKKIREQNQKSKILILTCHNDFTYAREALKSGADDYILKFEAEDEELIRILTNVKEHLDAERNERERYNYLKKQMDTNITSLKAKLLKDLLESNPVENDSLRGMCSNLNFAMQGSKMSLVTFYRDDGERKVDFSEQDWQHMNNAIISIASSMFDERKIAYLVNKESDELLFLLSDESMNIMDIHEVIESIRESIAQYFDISLSAAISRIFEDIREASAVYQEIKFKSEQLFYLDDGCVINVARKVTQNINIFNAKKSYEKLLQTYINEENQEKSLAVIEDMESFFRKNNVKDVEVKLCYSNIISNFFEAYDHCMLEKDKVKDYTYYHNRIMSASKVKHIVAIIKEIIIIIIDSVKNYRHSNSNLIIREAIDYIEKNFQKKISLQSLASHLNLSKHYVCYLFKKETGDNITFYLNKVRIEKAKQMLIDSNYKVKEIYHELGFSDQQYFSKIFKKITGITIMQYKDSIWKNNEQNK